MAEFKFFCAEGAAALCMGSVMPCRNLPIGYLARANTPAGVENLVNPPRQRDTLYL